MKDKLFDRAVKASARYLELKGYEVLEQHWSPEGSEQSIPLIASDDDILVFIDVTVKDGADGFVPESQTERESMEILAAGYLSQSGMEPDFRIRFDIQFQIHLNHALLSLKTSFPSCAAGSSSSRALPMRSISA